MKINYTDKQVLVFKYKNEGMTEKEIKKHLEMFEREENMIYEMVKFRKKS